MVHKLKGIVILLILKKRNNQYCMLYPSGAIIENVYFSKYLFEPSEVYNILLSLSLPHRTLGVGIE